MQISFVMPRMAHSGGLLIIAELCNRLVEKGHSVSIYYSILPAVRWKIKTRAELRGFVAVVQQSLFLRMSSLTETKFPVVRIPWISRAWIKDADLLIVGCWEAAWVVRGFPSRKGKKVYYIHDLIIDPDRMDRMLGKWSSHARRALELPFFRIVITRGMQEEMHNLGLKAEYVPNALDPEEFHMSLPLGKRDPHVVAMLYANSSLKGVSEGLEALASVYRVNKQLRVLLFGSGKLNRRLEPWVEWLGFVPHDRVCEIFNRASIYLCPSAIESWGLPSMEAMACGCALVSTQTDGVQEYTEDGVSALLAPVGDVDLLASHVCRLVSDDALRMRIAEKGMKAAQHFTWERSADLFEQALFKALREG